MSDACDLIVGQIRCYLNFIDNPPANERERMELLVEHIDRLLASVHMTEDTDPDTEELARRESDYSSHHAKVAKAFPELGYYPIVDPLDDAEQEIILAGSIDDIVDIAEDLRNVLWHAEQGKPNDAIFAFRVNYEIHWGHHAVRLRQYLHHRLYRG